ncbi:MAG: ABC transporter substrate-binding protein [Acetobacteraceae bacterium]|nr:ABC transporter substrate-binding protein [Acetobacteraceae bacterium]
MILDRRTLLGTTLAAGSTLALPRRGRAQSNTIKIGVLNDQSGPYRDLGGMHSVNAAKMAIKEMGAGLNVEVISADHQNKPDIGAGIVRQWIDQDGVDMILDVNTSSVALAVNGVCKQKNISYINNGAGTTDLTGPQCTPVTIHWGYDVYMLAQSTGGALVKSGGKNWYFITADYVFGQQLQRDASFFVKKEGGQVTGASMYPFPGTSDFSSFLISAQSSGADVLGLANAGADTTNCIKQAAEFGLTQKMKIAALLMYINDVKGLGLEAAQGLFLTESFYWDLDDKSRAFSKRFEEIDPAVKPNMDQASCYASTLHFLKTVKEMGVDKRKDGAAVVAQMKKTPAQDDAYGTTHIREDGWAQVPAYLFQVKSPKESKGTWDYYKLVQTTKAGEAGKPMSEGGCPLVKS